MLNDYKDQISKPLYEESKRQIDNATDQEVLNENTTRKIARRK